MRCRAVEIEFGRTSGFFRSKSHVTVSTSDIECVLVAQFKHLVADLDNGFSFTHIENAKFTSCGEMGGLEQINGFKKQRLTHRLGSAHYHAVVHGIDHIHLIIGKEVFDEEIAAQACRVVAFCVVGMCGIAQFIVRFHVVIKLFIGFGLHNCQAQPILCKDSANKRNENVFSDC